MPIRRTNNRTFNLWNNTQRPAVHQMRELLGYMKRSVISINDIKEVKNVCHPADEN